MLAALVVGSTAGAVYGHSHRRATPVKLVRAGTSGTVYLVSSTCADSPCVHLSRTSDDGAHFTSVAAPPVGGHGYLGDFSVLAFANVNDGIALEGGSQPETNDTLSDVVYATYDGARTWVRESLGAHVLVVSLSSSATDFYAVVANCTQVDVPCTSFRLAESPVGHGAWTFRALANQEGLATFGASVAAVGTHVWISEDRSSGSPVLATSTDRGARFALRAAPSLGNVVACELFATSTASLWVECPTGLEVDFQHSVDGGATWHGLDVGQTSGTGSYGFDPVAGDTAFVSRGLGGGLFRVTGTDGLVTVSDRTLLVARASLAFTNGRDGLVIGSASESAPSRLEATTDGGRAWHGV